MVTNAIKGLKSTLQFNAALSSAIAGTRTSATVFTRSSGTWTTSELVGSYVQSYVGAAPLTYAWDKVTANSTTAVTIDGTLLAAADNIKTGVVISELQSLSGSRTRTAIDVLSCDSTNQAVEILAGSLNEGEVSTTLVYDGSDSGIYNTLNTAFQAATSGSLVLTYQGVSRLSGTAIITSLATPSFGSPDDSVTLDLILRWSGQATFTDVA